MSRLRESHVESYLCREVARLDRRALCVKAKVRRGWPDRSIYWSNGIHDLVETKRPQGGRFEPLQLRTHERLRSMGHNVFVLLTKEEVDEYISSRK